ncbi:histidine phosphatase family protein [Leptotrichia sp. oral taxon 223]|uniref:histidine phosphatase family protein n=1 Tax=Leptotrichia sp. oral taxon 223 TaxID=712363 RepID=UPI0015BC939B|nr:histidine phosphatase family protein [Leptotrichia sp. oral taxon 223]NWO18925.1 histidine phosphatase family protein [Leptotrichia sp. oral taxon 223]
MKEKLKLYIVRHGQTEWNVQEKFQGQLNSPLTEEGKVKIRKTATELADIEFEAVYTSKLGRTVGTAEIILESNNNEKRKNDNEKLKLQKLSELNEIYFGEWQGMTFAEIFVKFPEEAHNYFYDVKNYCAGNVKGEELQDGLKRFLRGLNKIVEENNSGNVLVVTHGTVLELFFNYIENKEANDLDERKLIGNGEYKVFTYENGKYFINSK